MKYVEVIANDGTVSVTLSTSTTVLNRAYWQAVCYSDAGTTVEAVGFTPKRSNPYRTFSFGRATEQRNPAAFIPHRDRMIASAN